MAGDLEKLFRLKNEKYRIKEIHIKFDKAKEPNLTVTVTLERNGEILTFSSAEKDCVSYIIHLHSIPHIEDDEGDFVYIDNPDAFFNIQKKIVDIFSGKQEELVICEIRIDSQRFKKRIEDYERKWILSEKNIRIFPTKLCQIFWNVGVLMTKESVEEFELIDKEKFKLGDLQNLLHKSQEYDLAVCFSAFILAPKIPIREDEQSDSIVGLITYDLKNKRTLSFNLNTLRQFQRKIDNVGQHGLWECVFALFERTSGKDSFTSFVPLPLNIRDFTPLPWLCYVFLKGIHEDNWVDGFTLNLPLFIAFGTPLMLLEKPSYIFNSKDQKAFVMLGFRDDDEISYHQVRFDVSKGEPNLHLDYEIYPEKGISRKIIDHLSISYKDIWDFSENLAIGFLAASAYDVNFDTVIIPERIRGIKEVFRKNPLTVYPLFVRSMAGRPYRWLKERPEAIDALKNIVTRRKIINGKKLISELEDMGLIRQGKLTILGDIVYARLQQ